MNPEVSDLISRGLRNVSVDSFDVAAVLDLLEDDHVRHRIAAASGDSFDQCMTTYYALRTVFGRTEEHHDRHECPYLKG